MTSQQDTELSRILDKYAEHYFNEVEGFKSNHTLTKAEAIQALTSWKDKEVTKTDVRTLETVCMLLNGDDNQLEVVRNYARNKLKMYNERKKSLQSQGGKMVQIKERKGE